MKRGPKLVEGPARLPECLTVQEVATRLRLSQATVYQLCEMGEENGGLDAFRFRTRASRERGAIRIPIDSLERYCRQSYIRESARSR